MKFLVLGIVVVLAIAFGIGSLFLEHFGAPVEVIAPEKPTTTPAPRPATPSSVNMPVPYNFRGPSGLPYIIGPQHNPPNY